MSDKKDTPKVEPKAEPKGSTGRTTVDTQTQVEDFTGSPAANPYDRKVEVKTEKLDNGTIVETYE